MGIEHTNKGCMKVHEQLQVKTHQAAQVNKRSTKERCG